MLYRASSVPALLTLNVLFAALPGYISALVFADGHHQQALANVQAKNLSFLQLVSMNQSQVIANTRSIINLVSSAPDVRNHNKAGCESLLTSVVKNTNRFDGLAEVDENQKPWRLSQNVTSTQPSQQRQTFQLPNA
jgi:hypothetical protein